MKSLPATLQAHLDGGATTLCWCWRLIRRDGVVLGFTDHDRPLSFDGTKFEASTGFTASELKETIGLSVDNLDVSGAISSERLDELDLLAGIYDDAHVEIFRVNWQDTAQRVLMRSGSLGEVRRTDQAFTAEVRGLAHYLQQPQGRLYQNACDADLGDRRCTVDLTSATYRGSGTVSEVLSERRFAVAGFDTFTAQWFTRGLLAFDSGANQDTAFEVRDHELSNAGAVVELWRAPARDIQAGDQLTLTAGCDKALATCRDKFANVENFRGFPSIPGMDFVTSYVRQEA